MTAFVQTLGDYQDDVRSFMEQINRFSVKNGFPHKQQSIGNSPAIRDGELRATLIMEEARETAEALTGHRWDVIPHPAADPSDRSNLSDRGRIVGAVDGMADILVVTIGSAVACGIDLAPVYEETMRANWTKFAPGATMRADGKLVKSPEFKEPDIAGELRKQGWGG